MKRSLISVIIPVYNSASYLRECLDSVVHNTYKNLEIICVNDGSTDASLQILNEYALRDSRFIILSQKNSGQAASRHAGLQKASGEWVSFIDSDDAVNERFFELLITAWEKTKKKADIVIAGRLWNSPGDLPQAKDTSCSEEFHELSFDGIRNNMIAWGVVWGKIYQRSLIQEIRTPNHLSYAEDTYFNLCAIGTKNDVNIVVAHGSQYFYRISPTSFVATSSIRDKHIKKRDACECCLKNITCSPSLKAKALACEMTSRILIQGLHWANEEENDEVSKSLEVIDLCIGTWKTAGFCSLANTFHFVKVMLYRHFPILNNLGILKGSIIRRLHSL